MKNQRPHLLLITTDQQRFDALGAAGNPHIYTPHLDWLAARGVLFSRCYSDAPSCAAARSTLITGRHYYNQPAGIGDFHQPSAADAASTLPALLTRHGYQTKAVGKMHYHPPRCNYGWEDMEILEDYYREMARHPQHGIPANHGLGQNEMQPGISTVDESHSLTTWTVRQSIDFLETRDPTRPFCLYTSFSKPHPPFDPCLSYWTLYQNATVPSPLYGDWSQRVEDIDAGWMQPTWIGSAADALSEEQLIQCRRAYYALITQIDYNLGLLFARLREMELLDNTLILFTADHGDMLGDHHFGAKTVPLEGAAHIPMLMMPPAGVLEDKRGTVDDSLVCLADVLLTFCRLAGIEKQNLPDGDGIDLCGVAAGATKRDLLMIRYNGYHTVLNDNYKYAFCEKGASELMFDLAHDPHEQHELIRAGTHGEVRERLRRILLEQLQSENHPACIDGELVSTGEPRSRQRCRAYPWPGFHHPMHTPSDLMH